MSRARDIMHPGAECIAANETLQMAAQKMRDLQVGALPICGEDNRLAGIITDRDIVTKCVAEGRDPSSCTASELAQGTPVWVEADAEQHRIRRIPVMENRKLVGMISEADIAMHLTDDKLAHFANSIYAAPPTS
jgi:CBS domain-containing protein